MFTNIGIILFIDLILWCIFVGFYPTLKDFNYEEPAYTIVLSLMVAILITPIIISLTVGCAWWILCG